MIGGTAGCVGDGGVGVGVGDWIGFSENTTGRLEIGVTGIVADAFATGFGASAGGAGFVASTALLFTTGFGGTGADGLAAVTPSSVTGLVDLALALISVTSFFKEGATSEVDVLGPRFAIVGTENGNLKDGDDDFDCVAFGWTSFAVIGGEGGKTVLGGTVTLVGVLTVGEAFGIVLAGSTLASTTADGLDEETSLVSNALVTAVGDTGDTGDTVVAAGLIFLADG